MSLLPFGKDVPVSIGDLQSEMNRVFDRFWHGGLATGPLDGQDWAPPLDVIEQEDRYVIRAEVPGLEAKDIEVSVTGSTLTLRGHKASELREDDDSNVIRAERRFGSFHRAVELPAAVETEGVAACCKRGVLEIALTKKEDARAKTIRVDVQD